MRRALEPFDVASLALGLVGASLAVAIADLETGWHGWVQLVVLVLATVLHGYALRLAFRRARDKSAAVLGAWSWFLTGLAWAFGLGLVAGAASLAGPAHAGGAKTNDAVVAALELATAGLFLGLFVGFVLQPLVFLLRAVGRRPLIDVLDRMLVVAGAIVACAGLAVTNVQALDDGGYGGFVVLAVSTVMFALAGIKIRTRARWLHAVLRGEVASWVVTDPFEGDAQLPAIGGWMKDPGVLATGNAAGGPFRAGGAVSPVARVDRAGGYMRLAYVAFAGAALTLAAVPLAFRQRALARDHMPYGAEFDRPQRFANVGRMDDLVVGTDTVCAHLTEGNAKCWGSDAGWLFGTATTSERTPTIVPALRGTKVFVAGREACTVQVEGGMASCLGVTPAVGPRGVEQVAFGEGFRLLLDKDGGVTQVGAGSDVEMLDLPPVRAVSAAGRFACMLTREGAVFCEGKTTRALPPWEARLTEVDGFDGGKVDRLGVRDADGWARVTTPDGERRWYVWNERHAVLQPRWSGVEDIALNVVQVCGRRRDGSVFCEDADVAPAAPQGPRREMLPAGSADQIAGSYRTTCARGASDVWCWGAL